MRHCRFAGLSEVTLKLQKKSLKLGIKSKLLAMVKTVVISSTNTNNKANLGQKSTQLTEINDDNYLSYPVGAAKV